ncbi:MULTISPECIES: hypothetical protein [unclassified Lentimicrobium]|uniref:hypothetical protein n=1 Tax=unclassified Lentimicrobium TaxID=2677434 RepID=UPI0015567BF6|nr:MULTISPECIES: hypothetical protein [unclassified Lentimicrobium]NPD43969.1 hypothetical protein [Lentimicrobium sp. S6]NPD84184.1 hypothetical protein [Lentimicrobium sp. L6]
MAKKKSSSEDEKEKFDELEEFNRFIEKKRIQNKALKKIIDTIEMKKEETSLSSNKFDQQK